MRVFRLREFIQLLMKCPKGFLKPQDGDQLLTYAGETIGLELSSLKLVNHKPISAQDQGH
jgi:hypothetical protein